MTTYLFRKGDGNEGNFPLFLVTVPAGADAGAALSAVLVDQYIPGSRTRRHIIKRVETEGEELFGFSAMVHEGPEGERAFDAAWLTAEFETLTPEDLAYYVDSSMRTRAVPGDLDPAARRLFSKLNRKG